MNCSVFPRWIAACWVALWATSIAMAQDTPRQPNVLLVLTEDQGPHMSALGTAGLQTPNMDRLLDTGVYFERAFVSYPVCSPSKASLYTGTYAHTNGLINNTQNFFVHAAQLQPGQRTNPIYQRVQIDSELRTLTEILKEAGYHTAVSGKLHVAPNEKFPYDEMFKPNETPRTTRMIEAAQAAGKPFFFFANIQAPHRPYRNSDEVAIGVDPAEVELPAFLPDTPVVRQDWAEYLDYVEVADAELGAVLRALEETGTLENTLIVFMGDHGPPYHRGKMSLYQFGLHVPFVICGPDIPQGVRTSEMASNVDLLATLTELLDLPVPPQQQGQSLAGVVRGDAGATGRPLVFAEIMHGGQQRDDGMQERSVFDGRYKLIYRENVDKPRDVNSDLKYFVLELPDGQKIKWRNRVYDEIVKRKAEFPEAFTLLTQIDPQSYGVTLPTFELYDTESDPAELHDVAGQPQYAEIERRLKEELRTWAVETGDRYVTAAKIR